MAIANDLPGLSWRLMRALRDEDNNTWRASEISDLVTWAVADLWPRMSRELPPQGTTITLVDETYYYALPTGVMAVSRVDWVDDQSNERGPIDGTWETVGDPIGGQLRLHVSPTIANQGGTLRILGYGRYGLTNIELTTSAESDDIIDTTVTHPFTAGTVVRFSNLSGGAGLSNDTPYYVISTSLAATTFKVSTAPGGTAVDFTTNITAGYASHNLIPDELVPSVIATARKEAYRRIAADRVQFKQWMETGESDTSITNLLALINEADNEALLLRRQHKTWQRPKPGRVP